MKSQLNESRNQKSVLMINFDLFKKQFEKNLMFLHIFCVADTKFIYSL